MKFKQKFAKLHHLSARQRQTCKASQTWTYKRGIRTSTSEYVICGFALRKSKRKEDRLLKTIPFWIVHCHSHICARQRDSIFLHINIAETAKLLHLVLAVYDLNSLRCLVRLAVCVPNHACTSQTIDRDLGHSRL